MDYRALVQKLGDRTNQNTQTSELILEHRTGHPSKLIYYRKVYNIEMMRPNGQDCVLKNYFINELNQLENFYNKNIDFYKYYRSGSTHLDKYFFLRGKQDIQMTMETFYFERDPNFSTICDFKVAKIVANEMLRIYLNPKIRNYHPIHD